MNATDFLVARNDLQQCKAIETQLPDAAALPADAQSDMVVHGILQFKSARSRAAWRKPS